MTRYLVAFGVLVFSAAPALCQTPHPTATPDCSSTTAREADHGAMDHGAHLAALDACAKGGLPTAPGQAAFAAIGEIVRILKNDAKTDWTKVNVEALRQHLIDMNEVTMQAKAAQRTIPGGIEVDVTGSGRAMGAIRRMTKNHTSMLERGEEYRASAREIPGGARLTVTARNPTDAAAVARIRGLGFAGIMTEGDHHTSHHLALARGDRVHQP